MYHLPLQTVTMYVKFNLIINTKDEINNLERMPLVRENFIDENHHVVIFLEEDVYEKE